MFVLAVVLTILLLLERCHPRSPLATEHKLSRQHACVGNWFESDLGHVCSYADLQLVPRAHA